MKKIYTTLVALMATLSMQAQGWPANYDGVMLQGFYWDSYRASKWCNLEAQAEAQWKFSGDKHKSLQVDTERTFHQRYPLAML